MYTELPSNYPLYISYVGVVIALLVIMALIFYYYLKDIVKYKRLNERIIGLRDNPVFWVRSDGTILNVQNEKNSEWIDGELLKAKNVKIKDLLPEKYYERWIRAANEVANTRKSKEVLMYYTTPSGELLYIRLDIIFYTKSILIVFEQNLSEIERERLENRKQRYIMQALLDNLPIPTTVKDVNNERRYLIWNKGTEELYSASQKKILGNTESVLNKELAEVFLRTDKETIANGKSSTIEHLRLADGKVHTLSMHKTLVCYENDKWIISSALDVTELEENRTELEQLNKRHELILKELGMVSWTWDRVTNELIWYCDPSHENKKKEQLNTSLYGVESFYKDVLPEFREKVKNAFEALRSGRTDTMNLQYQIVSLDHQKVWVETLGVISEREKDGAVKQIVGVTYYINKEKEGRP